MRIVSICPSNTELLAYLGLKENIVGIDNYSDWPDVEHLPKVGPDLDIDMDAVEKLQPDLVVASLSVPGMEKNIVALKERNLPFITLNPNSLQEIGEDILTLGEAVYQEKRARELAGRYQFFLQKYEQLSQQIEERPTIYWEWWAKPVFTPGGLNWLTEISRLAGAENVFADREVASVQTDWEDVRARDPDVIALVWVGIQKERVQPALVYKRPQWLEMKAIQKERLYVLDEPLFCRPSPRLLTGLKKLAFLLHPESYPIYTEGEDWL